MKTIELTKGRCTLVDDDMFDYLIQWSWFCSYQGYAGRTDRTGKQKTVLMHKVILPVPEGFEVDHINGDSLDNRRENLRACRSHENQKNRSLNPRNTSGYPGVDFNTYWKKYRARVFNKGKHINLGWFKTFEEAVEARKKGVQKVYKEYAPINPFRRTTIKHSK